MSDAEQPDLVAIYDSLWREGEAAVASGAVRIDPHLGNRAADRRRGLTVILRLELAARRAVEAFVDELRQLEPGQHFQAPRELHVTVLSLLTCAEDYQALRLGDYAEAVRAAIHSVGPFSIRFNGVTATSEAVMVQGFPDETLAVLRTRIFEHLMSRSLPQRQRYLSRTAHVTVMRFGQPLDDAGGLAEKLRSCRTRSFGATAVTSLEFVENDWYMSERRTRPLETFELST